MLATLLALACGAGASYVVYIFSRGELAAKPAWAVLQGAEFEDRDNDESGPILRRTGGYAVLGIPGVGEPLDGQTMPPASSRAWIVLNEHSAERAVRLLNAYSRYSLSCAYVDAVQARVPDADDYAVAHLRSICR